MGRETRENGVKISKDIIQKNFWVEKSVSTFKEPTLINEQMDVWKKTCIQAHHNEISEYYG